MWRRSYLLAPFFMSFILYWLLNLIHMRILFLLLVLPQLLFAQYEYKQYFDDSEQLYISATIKDSVWHGVYLEYYENGELASNLNYTEGSLEGTQKVFYPNGSLSQIINYKDDLEDGHWLEFFSNGDTLKKVNFQNGKEEGSFIEFYKNGILLPTCPSLNNSDIKYICENLKKFIN